LNAGVGNLGVSVMQFLVPLVITAGVFGALGGAPQEMTDGGRLWMQNAGFVWVPFILAATVAAWLGMNDLADAKASFKDQAVIFTRKHNWIMCWLYTGTFGSFIGYSAGFPLPPRRPRRRTVVRLLARSGALSRAVTGWCGQYGGGVSPFVFIGMIAAVFGVIFFLGIKDQPGAFWGFFACFMALFFFTGVGNSSTFQMIPVIMGREVPRLMPRLSPEARTRQIGMEAAAIIAFTSAIGARRLRWPRLPIRSPLAGGRSGCSRLLRDLPADLYYTPSRGPRRWSIAATPSTSPPPRPNRRPRHEPSLRPPELPAEEEPGHLRGRAWRTHARESRLGGGL
jgi:NNP family nitrate/nitrite transporter-like MFS transporter